MRGTKAKALRRQIYGTDFSHRDRAGTEAVARRRAYQKAKKRKQPRERKPA